MTDLNPWRERLQNRYELSCQRLTIAHRTIQLYRPATPDALLDQMLDQPDTHIDIRDERLPYWAELWPSSIALATFLMTEQFITPTTHVLELGCGLGLAGVAAGFATPYVTLTDYQPAALEFAELNWRHNLTTPFQGEILDWREPRSSLAADLVLAADVAYESRAFEPLVHAFRTLTQPGGRVLVAEPGRKVAQGYAETLARQLACTYRSHLISVKCEGVPAEIWIHVLGGIGGK